ncbi:MAG: PspC domain-containing protein [Alphaproteobacteria bacterium]|nr:PspC domain-containing protein [Alphaproteobacteria bacterium]
MERVIAVNLNGHSYTLDESAYARLKAYLDQAEHALRDNPDRAEIIRDLEQAIADKCNARLGSHKSVISDADVATALEEMGPVDGAEPAPDGARHESARDGGPTKRLYRVREGAVISGVCSGLGAYFDIDANIIRILFVVATFVTGGGAILVYIAMMFIVPSANTREEWAQAHGLAFNAQEVIERAKQDYARFTDDPPWGDRYRRKWRRRYREWRRGWDAPDAQDAPPPRTPVSYGVRMAAGGLAVLFTVIGAVLTVAFLFAIVSLLTSGVVLSWAPPATVPLWFAVIVLLIAFSIIGAPISAVRHWAYATMHGYPPNAHGWAHHRHSGLGFLFAAILVIVVVQWSAPEANDVIARIPEMARDLWQSIVTALR